jgi:putative oxidoreductase
MRMVYLQGEGERDVMKAIEKSLSLWRKAQAALVRYAILPVRLIVGYGFVAHGLAKWSKGPAAFASILHSTGVPAPHLMAWLTIATELIGGLAFLLGVFISLASIPAIALLAVAALTVHLPYGFSSIKLVAVVNGRAQFGPPGYECDLLYIACILTLALNGPGPWSVDAYRLRGDSGAVR